MSKILLSLWPYRIIRIALGIVFVIAGLPKLLDPKAFAKAVSMYEIVPEQILPLVALVVPITEVLAGIGLILNIKGSLTVIAGLLVSFITILSYGVFNDLDIDCGCSIPWESAKHANLKSALLRDLVMFGMVIYLYIWRWVSPYRHNMKLKTLKRKN
jgi:uncharacterized membrane protein YphA (DoxX/SURF4 family)